MRVKEISESHCLLLSKKEESGDGVTRSECGGSSSILVVEKMS